MPRTFRATVHRADQRRRKGRRRARRRKTALIGPRIPASYAASIRAKVDAWFRDFNRLVLPAYRRALALRDDESRADDLVPEFLTRSLGGWEVAFAERFPADTLARQTWRFGAQVDDSVRETVGREFEAVLGVDPLAGEPRMRESLNEWSQTNADLIGSIPIEEHVRTRDLVWRSWRNGVSVDELRKRIERRHEVTRSRANLIARDQIGKLGGELDMQRQASLGVTHYIWRTVEDERVRHTHRQKNGVRFSWREPPVDTGAPGWDYQCRCTAEPDLSAFGVEPDDVSTTTTEQALAQSRESGARERIGFRLTGAGVPLIEAPPPSPTRQRAVQARASRDLRRERRLTPAQRRARTAARRVTRRRNLRRGR